MFYEGFGNIAAVNRRLVLTWVLLAWIVLAGAASAQPVLYRSRSSAPPVTFSNEVVRIFQKNCQACHHPGDIAPFSLLTYSDAAEHASAIRRETQARRMPPWKPVPGYGEFQDERRLPDDEIALLARWIDSGAPEGDPRDLPPPLPFPDDWALGKPDVVLEPDADFQVPAEGRDTYRCFPIPLGVSGAPTIVGFDVHPGNRSVVHHVLVFQDSLGTSSRAVKAGDPQPGYDCFGGPGFLPSSAVGAWVPGQRPQMLPQGMGIRSTPGARAVVQVHYHSNGTPQSDRTRVGIYFAHGPVAKEYMFFPIFNDRFVIPAGDPSHTVKASFTVPPLVRAQAISITPHMHLLGREIRVDAVYPGGVRRPLIYIDDWDFHWQGTYYFREPLLLTPLTRLELTSIYDNSAANPNNPNSPPRDVRWGEQSTDEMCIAVVGFTLE